jgi:molecular chaperone GrpE
MRRLALRLRRRAYHDPRPKKRRVSRARFGSPSAESNGAGEAKALLERQRDQLLRLQAEFENFRRRSKREVDDIKQTAGADVLRALLPVIDNLDRALQTSANSAEAVVEGIKMIHAQMMETLKLSGLETVPALGEKFDPHLHEAVAVAPAEDAPDDSIVEVLQPGYAVKGKLIRPAMVKVARKG